MKKVPSDSFLPSGGIERESAMAAIASLPQHHHNHISSHYLDLKTPSSTVVDAITTCVPSTHAIYDPTGFSRTYPFEPLHDHSRGVYSPSRFSPSTSPSHHGAISSQFRPPPTKFPLDVPTETVRRSSSLSPVNIGISGAPPPPHHHPRPYDTAPHTTTTDERQGFRTFDPTLPPLHPSSLPLIQRLSHQNSLIREAWEAERKYLEANRRRAEEVYQEERAIMEDVREAWEAEKEAMLREMQTLRERNQRLEGENATLKALSSPTFLRSGLISPQLAPVSAAHDTLSDGFGQFQTRNNNSSLPPTYIDIASLPPGLEGASRRPHFASPGGSRMSPIGNGELSPFTTIDPRTQPQTSTTHDFLAPIEPASDQPVPVIDVQEIDSSLEGIPIRANAVQRSTFSEFSSKSVSSTATSPPPIITETQKDQPGQDFALRRASSKEHTLQVLAAGETRRRIMHAGHTPNHSLSQFPTMTATDSTAANSVAGQSVINTPKAKLTELASGETEEKPEEEDEEADTSEQQPTNNNKQLNQDDDALSDLLEYADEDDLPPLEPMDDDKPLKGPLMVKNIPAQDEIFWAQVNKKLEPISHGRNALPTVIKSQLTQLDDDDDDLDTTIQTGYTKPSQLISAGYDGINDISEETSLKSPAPSANKTVEPDVPLKFKTTANFGAPFGST